MIIYTATYEEWNKIKDKDGFASKDLDTEGFIHCSYPRQTTGVLNKHFKNEKKVMLLCIDPDLLTSEWKSEDLKGKGEEFPHVYGEINTDSIIKVIEIKPSKDGVFYENNIISLPTLLNNIEK
ncbi:DUF952 domain-containing protein [Dethiothermospora halolimnae]|uniref:DUF952 domain-containing protein n=1 Tax=Dethiothermospora halolimnae TaxID=3114390 RepID=UPI003CCBABA4